MAILEQYEKIQQQYDGEVNPNGTDDKEKQSLWDMRIRKCLENNTDEFLASPLNVAQTVRYFGQTVKRKPGEPALQFAVRTRPLYQQFPQEFTPNVMETTEWMEESCIIAFYSQHYYADGEDGISKENYRTLGYMYVPNGKDSYKRILIDTFANDGRPVKIAAAFFANADADGTKELVVVATSNQKDKLASGTLYMNRVYDNITKPLPGRLTRLQESGDKIEGGFEGVASGKPSKAKYKNAKEITDALKKAGYN